MASPASGKKKRKKKPNKDAHILMIFGLILSAAFVSTSVFLFFCMLPTIVAAVIDKTRKKSKVVTVGAMNLAGSVPFLVELWEKGHSMETAIAMVTSPQTIIVVYCAAGIGYLIDWAMSGIVTTVMLKRSEGRMIEIRKLQAEMVERWGQEVTGQFQLDAYGFPIPQGPDREPGKPKR